LKSSFIIDAEEVIGGSQPDLAIALGKAFARNWIRDAHRAKIGDEDKESDAARNFLE